MTFHLHLKQRGSPTLDGHLHAKYGQYEHPQAWIPHNYPKNIFTRLWPFVTPNNVSWPPQKTIKIINSIWPLNMLKMRSLAVIVLEILCLQGFDLLTSGEPKWPLTPTKNDRDHLLNISNPHAYYEIPHSCPSWDKVFTRFLTFWPLVNPNDLWPPQKW